MSPSHTHSPRKRRRDLTLEPMEERRLLSAGQGSTFAILSGSISAAKQVSTVQFHINPGEFTAGKGGRILLGIDVAGNPSTSIQPQIIGVKNSRGGSARALIHSVYSRQIIKAKKLTNPVSSAVMISLPVPKAGQVAATYTVQVRASGNTTGDYLLGFYLPGDVAGTGTVTTSDLQSIKSLIGTQASSSSYSFDADVNRDGIIAPADLAFASMNLNAGTNVSPIISVNLNPTADPLNNRITSQQVVNFTGTVSPGATVSFKEINGNSPVPRRRRIPRGSTASMCPWATARTRSR